MVHQNYAEETIPDLDSLLKNSKTIINEFDTIKRFRFEELFILQGNGEYYRNEGILKEIGYNNKSSGKAKSNNEIKGAYLFYDKDVPADVGISRGIIRRLKNNFIDKTHFEASLAYLIARYDYDETNGLYQGERSDFPFDQYRNNIQLDMRKNWSISIIPETDNYKMYFTELYLACELKTRWNSFETH